MVWCYGLSFGGVEFGFCEMVSDLVDPKRDDAEMRLDVQLRPRSFAEFIGQSQVVENLRVFVEAAKQRGDVLDHILFSGPPGLGKTTLASIVANELGTRFVPTTGPVLERPADLAGILTNLKRGDVLFIDEVHRMPRIVEEYLYSAMEDFVINIVLDSGPAARTIKLPLSRFTLIGATTREGLLTGAFRARFGVMLKLNYYPPRELSEVIVRSAGILGIEIEGDASELMARRARGTPRLANRLLRRLRDVAQVKGEGRITVEIAELGLSMLGIDEEGCEATDRAILGVIMEHGGGPVGIKTIAVSVGEEADTIEDVYEPYLIRKGFLRKTQRGRMLSEKAYRYMGEKPPEQIQKGLFGSGSGE